MSKTRQQLIFRTAQLFYVKYMKTSFANVPLNKSPGLPVYKSVNCTNCHCSLDNHTNEINLLCNAIIDSCVSAGKNCIPLTGHNLKKKSVPGWVEQVAPQKERSLLWHWIWQEAGNQTMVIFII